MLKTNQKLQEASFFLSKMKENYTSQDFDYYLSAFVSACRSVLWVLAAEHKSISGWSEWYESLKPGEAEKAFLKATNDLRVRSEKHSPVVTDRMGVVAIAPEIINNLPEPLRKAFLSGNWKDLDIKLHTKNDTPDADSNRHYIPFLATTGYRELPEFKGQDILKVCSRYYAQVSDVVEKSRSKFAS